MGDLKPINIKTIYCKLGAKQYKSVSLTKHFNFFLTALNVVCGLLVDVVVDAVVVVDVAVVIAVVVCFSTIDDFFTEE